MKRVNRRTGAIAAAIVMLSAPTLVAGCDDGGTDEAIEEMGDEIDDAKDAVEDEIDDRT